MQIRVVGSEKQSKLKGNVVNVESDLNVCAKILPRKFDETSTVQVKLMRKMNYNTPYMHEVIHPQNVYLAAQYLVKSEVYQAEDVRLSPDWRRIYNGDTQEFDLDAPNPPDCEDDEEVVEDTGVGESLIFCERQDASRALGVRVAPAEGNIPIALYRDNNAEVLSFPKIYGGKQRKFEERHKITYTDIAKSELRRYDRRACVPTKLLYSFKRSFNEKVMQAIQICLRKTTGTEHLTAGAVSNMENVRHLLDSDDGYAVFKNLRSSPSYWKEKTKKVMAMIRQLGKPALFITLSAAETKWTELKKMLYEIKERKDITEEDVQNLPFNKIAELIAEDPVTCMRHFDHRLRAAQNLLLKPEGGIFAPYRIQDHFDRGEFQMRGSPHDHGLYWVMDAPVYNEDDEDSIKACQEFIDEFITVDRNEEGEMKELIAYQLHKHSHTCKKRSNSCRFGFPKPPMDTTRILQPLPRDYDKILKKKGEEIFKKIQNTCDNFGRHFEEDIPFFDFLESLDISYADYIIAIRTSIKRVTVFVKRSTNATFINPYNTKLLLAWKANMDIQFIIDTYACAKYCVGYILKGEGGVSKLLQTLTRDVKKGNISARAQVKQFASILINGSEISAQEAAGFLLGIANTHCTKQDVFINTSMPEKRISMLKSAEELQKLEHGSTEICVKGLLDHYQVRPEISENMTLAEFASMYEYTKIMLNGCKLVGDGLFEASNKQKTQYLKLSDNTGYMRKRVVRKIIRYRHYGKNEETENYCREQLMLFLPWRDEYSELLDIDVIGKATENHDTIIENSKDFIFNRQIDEDNLLNNIINDTDDENDDDDVGSDYEEHEDIIDENDISHFEETDDPHSARAKSDQFLPPKRMEKADYLMVMRSLNEKQRRFVLHKLHLFKTSDEPFYSFLSGGAGVGKSHVIKAIVQSFLDFFSKFRNQNPDSICVLVAAPTGKAAFNISGMTLHCTFRLMPNQSKNKVAKMDDGQLNSLRIKLINTKLFIIDEISMVSVKQLFDIDHRLRQIFATDMPFGGRSMIVVGHMRQLAPIGGSYIFTAPTNLPLGELAGNQLWPKFYLYELEEIMRQRGEYEFCKALNNMSEGIMDDADIALIRSREVTKDNQPPRQATNLFQTNNECDIYNQEYHQELKTDGAISIAHDTIDGKGNRSDKEGLLEYAKKMTRTQNDGLPYETALQVEGEYFVSTNIDVADGLFNGSTGVLKLIEYGTGADDIPKPIRAWMDFKNNLIGIKEKTRSQSYQKTKNIDINLVRINRISRNLTKNKQGHGGLHIVRKQIPLVAANGMTIAKSQGSTMELVVVHMKKYHGKESTETAKGRKLSRENLYVACSRAKSLNGLFIVGNFVPPTQPPANDPVTMEMERLRTIPYKFSIKFLQDVDDTFEKVFFHNVQSLVEHLPDVVTDQCCMASNLVCFVEPHLLEGEVLEVPNYSSIYRVNCRSRPRNSEGALVLRKNGEPASDIHCSSVSNFTSPGHCIIVSIAISGVNLIMSYKHPQYSKASFMQKLSEILSTIEGKIILFGDVNINLKNQEGATFINMLKRFGMTSKLNIAEPSTDHGTHIDCCFANFPEMEAWFYESYFSLHKPICVIWPKPR